MESNSPVEWDLVNYGAGSFYVASYQDKSGDDARPAAEELQNPPVELVDTPVPNCLLYRCWSALRQGCGTA